MSIPCDGVGVTNQRSVQMQLTIRVQTVLPTQFIDITDRVTDVVREAGLESGLAVLFTHHTTTGLLVNEHEPLLLEDLLAQFETLVPTDFLYAHDDFRRRTVNLGPNERRNGHGHCRAALLRTSEMIPVAAGSLALGRWQRLFLVDFDGGQQRCLTISLIGIGSPIS